MAGDQQFYTNESAVNKANVIKTGLATAKLRLIDASKMPTPQVTNTRADFEAAEATFDGYTSGGYTIGPFTGPSTTVGGGATLTSGLLNASYGPVGTPPVTNSISGWWIEDAATPTPGVRIAGSFNPPRPMAAIGDFIQQVIQMVEGKNAIPPSV